MIKKNRPVKNPLSLMTAFAGIAETGLVYLLKFLNSELQFIFIWFVVGFPILLVLLFFVILFIKPTSLYAPSDYKDEQNFMIAMQTSIIKGKIRGRH